MPAVSGSPTQNRTAVTSPTDLAGVPCDQFKSGDLAWVDLVPFLGVGATYRFRRGAPPTPPDWVTIVQAFEQPDAAYWELFLGPVGPEGAVGPEGPAGPIDRDVTLLLCELLMEVRKMRFYISILTDVHAEQEDVAKDDA